MDSTTCLRTQARGDKARFEELAVGPYELSGRLVKGQVRYCSQYFAERPESTKLWVCSGMSSGDAHTRCKKLHQWKQRTVLRKKKHECKPVVASLPTICRIEQSGLPL